MRERDNGTAVYAREPYRVETCGRLEDIHLQRIYPADVRAHLLLVVQQTCFPSKICFSLVCTWIVQSSPSSNFGGALTAFLLEVPQNPQEILFFWEEEAGKRFVVRQLVAFVAAQSSNRQALSSIVLVNRRCK